MNLPLFRTLLVFSCAALFFWVPPLAGQAGIEGLYQFIEDQPSNISPAKGAEIILNVSPGGEMFITATKPGQVLNTQGTYVVRGDRMSLDFPELDKSVKDGPWRLDKDILLLPLQFIGDGPGTSKWRRLQSGNGPIQAFFEVLNREYESGTKALQAIQRAAEEARRVSMLRAPQDKALRIRSFEPWADGTGISFKFEDGHEEEALTETGPAEAPAEQSQTVGLLARDPRTHIPCQPHTSPDDPQNKTAVLFAPFDTTPVYLMHWGVGGLRFPAVYRIASHSQKGENLDFLRKKLESRNYEVIIKRDSEATPLALHDAILGHKPAPGVIYFSTHGGYRDDTTIFLATGVSLGVGPQEDEIHETSERVKGILDRTVPAGYYGDAVSRGYVEAKPRVVTLWVQKFKKLPVTYLCISNWFFDRIREEGADFSSTFIYANGCNTARNNALAESSKARMVLGNRQKPHLEACLSQARWIFTRLAKRTFSLSEVLGLMGHIAKTREKIFPEDTDLKYTGVPQYEILCLFGADGKEAEIPNFDVLYLCWLARWDAKDTDAGAEALQTTYVNFWKKKSFSRMKSPFANAGVRGAHVPTEEEVSFARHLVSGVPTRPSGRFTLNDKDPGKNQAQKTP